MLSFKSSSDELLYNFCKWCFTPFCASYLSFISVTLVEGLQPLMLSVSPPAFLTVMVNSGCPHCNCPVPVFLSDPPFEREALLECARDLPSLRVNRFRRARLVFVPPPLSSYRVLSKCLAGVCVHLDDDDDAFRRMSLVTVSGESVKKNDEQMSITVCVLVCEHFLQSMQCVWGSLKPIQTSREGKSRNVWRKQKSRLDYLI